MASRTSLYIGRDRTSTFTTQNVVTVSVPGSSTSSAIGTPSAGQVLRGGNPSVNPDRAVPFSHGQWLASRIPRVETWFFDDEGHALRENHIEDVHA